MFARHAAAVFHPVIEDVLAGRSASPLPPLGWVRRLTLGGLLPVGGPLPAHAVSPAP